jgi:phage anti-repressor protein
MSHDRIVEFNRNLVRQDSKYDIFKYINQINSMHKNPIDLSFMEELIQYVIIDDFILPHTLLITYKVLSDTNVSADTKRLLDQYDFVENEDYRLCNVAESNRGGRTHAIDYFLHPKTFKYCLMRAKNTKLYAKYYLLLEESVKYYHDYQLMYKEYILSQKDDKINLLSNEIAEIKQLNLEQSKEINRILGHTIDIKEDMSTLLDVTIEQIELNELSQVTTRVASNDRINIPKRKYDTECLAIVRNEDNSSEFKYKTIRGTYTYVKATIGKLTGTKFQRLTKHNNKPWLVTSSDPDNYEYTFIKAFSDVSNARHLFRASEELKFESSGVNFNTSMSESDLLEYIQKVYDNRLSIPLLESDTLEAKKKSKSKIKEVKSKTRTCNRK